MNKDGSVQAQGIWAKNEWLTKNEVINSFENCLETATDIYQGSESNNKNANSSHLIYVPQHDAESRLQMQILRVTLENEQFLQEIRTYLQDNDIEVENFGVEN